MRLPAWSLLASGLLHGLLLASPARWSAQAGGPPASLAVRLPSPKALPPKPAPATPAQTLRRLPLTRPASLAQPPAPAMEKPPDTGQNLAYDQRISDLHYKRFYDENPHHPMRCMVGHVAQSSGDHKAALYIYQDCAARGDTFSLVSLAVYYELGTGGIERDPAKAAALFLRAAQGNTGYAPNGMFYYGLSLYYGLGVAQDTAVARDWLGRAAAGGVRDAEEFLKRDGAGNPPPVSDYFKV